MIRDNKNYINYFFSSNISRPENPALTSFENDNIYNMIRNIEFRNVHSNFQDKLKEGIDKKRPSNNLFFWWDKSTNLYEMPDTDYKSLLGNKVTSYQIEKCRNIIKQRIDKET